MSIFSIFKKPPLLNVSSDSGELDLPVVIFLHGIASSSATWDNLTPLLKNKYRVVTIDLLGFAGSPKPIDCDYLPIDHLRSIRRTIKSLKVKHFILAGHSLGSLLTVGYAARWPRNIDRLILVSPPVYVKKGDAGKRYAKILTNAYMKAYSILRTKKGFTLKASKQIEKYLPTKGIMHIDEEIWHAFSASLKNNIENQNIVNELQAITKKVDIFYGAFDQFIIESSIKSLAALDNVSTHKIRKSDHVIRKNLALAIAKNLRPNAKNL